MTLVLGRKAAGSLSVGHSSDWLKINVDSERHSV